MCIIVVNTESSALARGVWPGRKTAFQNSRAEKRKHVCCSACMPSLNKAASNKRGRCHVHRAAACNSQALSGCVSSAHGCATKRFFVHPPIKAELCKWATGDRSWLAKVRPYYGHDYHFHVRIKCPANSPGCKDQWLPNPKDGTGCGEELAWWMSDAPWRAAKPAPPNQPPPKPMTISALPAECRKVVTAQ